LAEEAQALDAIASPLNLLSDEEAAREVLVLSFTLNLEFWERYALSVARGLGARVTIVGDVAMVHGDPAHVRYAGVTYLDGRAACSSGGVFHPKLFVVAGEDYATVAIGSGNATLSGWHSNAELWTVLRGDSTGAPETFSDLAAWLRGLPTVVRFTDGVEPALVRTAELLEALPATEPGPRLLTSLEVPVLDQLPAPAGGTDQLVVVSPFYDRHGSALAGVLERLGPRETRLLLQPRDVVADGSALARLLEQPGRVAETIASERYHHGKLIEWVEDGRRLALTGSPNMSSAALEKSMAERGGNCELAVLAETTTTLAPESGGRYAIEQLAAIVFDARVQAAPAITLLGVILAPDRVKVTLGRPLADEGVLEYLEGAVWTAAASIPAAHDTEEASVVLAPGSAVRVRQGEMVSNVCFVADPSRFVRTRVEHVGRVRTDEQGVFRDPSVADAFAYDLAELREFLTPTVTAAGQTGGRGGDRAPQPVAFTSWEEYLDACEAHVGPHLLAYGLALPALDAGEGRREEQDAGSLTDEDAGAVGDESDGDGADEPTPAPVFNDLPDHQRRRYQRWCERLVELSPQLPYAGRLIALRLLLDAVRGDLFPSREQWLPLVASATEALGSGIEMAGFDEERVRAASLAAVSLAAMRSKLRQFAEWEELRFPYECAVDAVLPILNSSDPDVVARYGAPLEAYFGPAVQPALVESLVDSLLQPDPIAAAVALAEQELHLSVERRDNVIEIDTYLAGDPRRTLLAVVSLCEGAAVAVTTMPWNGPRAYAVWRPPELVLVIPRTGGVRGAHHVLRGFGPGAFKDDIESLPEPRHRWFSEEEAPDEVKELVKVSGL
jgi:hypothetical protein